MPSGEQTVIIVGAGITGIGAAYHLKARGISCVVLEATSEIGGVWNTQRWHGARCDSDIIKYSFSFKPLLSATCLASRAEIHRYLRSVVWEFGIAERIRFNTEVRWAAFDSRRARWTVETSRGTFTAPFLLNANGYFADAPYVPAFAGAEKFAGETVHTRYLDDSRTFHDKNVVLVGSGATAISCAPKLADVSQSLTLLQRSPAYIYDIDDGIGWGVRIAQALYRRGVRFPVHLGRHALQLKDDLIFVGFRRFPSLARAAFRRHCRAAVGEHTLAEHFTPRYNPWEQRIPIALGLWAAIRAGKVIMRTARIHHFTRRALVLDDGSELPCDVCVLATGYEMQLFKFPLMVDGARVSTDRINYFKGIMMGGIPNYFQPTGVLHSAWTQRSETATRYAIRVMEYMRKHGHDTVCVQRRFVDTAPTLSPGYITRHPELPRIYGTFGLPTLDTLLRYHFSPKDFEFRSRPAAHGAAVRRAAGRSSSNCGLARRGRRKASVR